MGIANRDIKLENTLLMDESERPVLKLCDFGYSKDELCASISKTMCGENCTVMFLPAIYVVQQGPIFCLVVSRFHTYHTILIAVLNTVQIMVYHAKCANAFALRAVLGASMEPTDCYACC